MSVLDTTSRESQKNVYVSYTIVGSQEQTMASGVRIGTATGLWYPDHQANDRRRDLREWALRVRVDTDDANHEIYSGSSLTAGQKSFEVRLWENDVFSLMPFTDLGNEDPLGTRIITYYFKNLDSNTHTYYSRVKGYKLRISGDTL